MFDLARRLGATGLSLGIKTMPVLPQLLQVIHLLTMGVVIVSVLVIALRIHGLAFADQSVQQTWNRFASWFWVALSVMALTGIAMALGEPLREASALSFWLKMSLVLLGILGMFKLRRMLSTRTDGTLPASARHTAKLVLLAWMLVLFLGRSIGYDIAIWGSLSPKAHLW
jgi:uncharacterized membrane protein YqgA involved in biofilm formation